MSDHDRMRERIQQALTLDGVEAWLRTMEGEPGRTCGIPLNSCDCPLEQYIDAAVAPWADGYSVQVPGLGYVRLLHHRRPLAQHGEIPLPEELSTFVHLVDDNAEYGDDDIACGMTVEAALWVVSEIRAESAVAGEEAA